MNLLKSLMGRRQFLVAAGAASTCALAGKRLAGLQTNSSTAAAYGAPAYIKPAASKYPHLLSPIRIGDVVLKNRMYSTCAVPHFIQGPENFPAETSRTYAINLAKNGASIVTCRIIRNRVRKELFGDSAHMVIFDTGDAGVQNYLDQLTEGIHCYGSKASWQLVVEAQSDMPQGMPAPSGGEGGPEGDSDGGPGPGEMPQGGFGSSTPTITPAADLKKIIDAAVNEASFFHNHGFDSVSLYESMAPQMKIRTDEYGGSLKNRARFSTELYQAIKKACGQDFLIEATITLIDPSIEQDETDYAYTMDEIIDLAKIWEGSLDIMQLRMSGGMPNHPTGWNSEKNKPLTLKFSEALKKSGTEITIAPNGGFQDLAFNNECIEKGKADMIAMGHAFICDWEYGKKAYEARGEDVTPCIMCNRCHGLSQSGQWYTVCSVNPRVGIDSAAGLIDAPSASKKVAVIGGGPAGMKTALTAAERGHRVTLYEKGTALGGLTRHSDYSQYKWPLREYKDFLIRQLKKAGVEVILGTEATPDMIRKKGYDAVVAAVGADPAIPRIPGVDGKNVYNVVDVYAKERELGMNVVFVGGGEFGVETGIFLAKAGHKVTMVTSERQLMKMNRVHYPEQIMSTYSHLKNFSSLTKVTVTRISEGKVTYTDAKGNEKSVQADSVVVYAGLKARKDAALGFYDTAPRFFAVGDCTDQGGDVQRSVRSAFFAASQIY